MSCQVQIGLVKGCVQRHISGPKRTHVGEASQRLQDSSKYRSCSEAIPPPRSNWPFKCFDKPFPSRPLLQKALRAAALADDEQRLSQHSLYFEASSADARSTWIKSFFDGCSQLSDRPSRLLQSPTNDAVLKNYQILQSQGGAHSARLKKLAACAKASKAAPYNPPGALQERAET